MIRKKQIKLQRDCGSRPRTGLKTRFFALCLTAMVTVLTGSQTQAAEKSWGLHFPFPGEVPKGNESAEYLKGFDAYYVGESEEKVIYLTFDAGYENGYTDAILDTLKKTEVPATFFLVGTYIRDYPDLVKRMVNEGHIVGNHTMSHPNMSKISDKESFSRELFKAEEQYKNATNQDMPKYYRPPEGTYSEPNMQMAKELGYKTIFWSLAYADWDANKQPTKDAAFSKLIPRIHSGAILLLHSTSKTNSIILEDLINEYKKMGYSFKSLDELSKSAAQSAVTQSDAVSVNSKDDEANLARYFDRLREWEVSMY